MVETQRSPLAGGFLTGKLSAGGDLTGTRFEDGNMMGAVYRKLYDKQVMHSAIEKLQNVVQSHGITTVAASLRWLAFHSMLGKDDGIILGASKVAHIQGNAKDIKKGPLPEGVVKALEQIWGIVKKTRTKL